MGRDSRILPKRRVTKPKPLKTATAGPPLDAIGIPAYPTTQGVYVLTLHVAADGTTPGPVWEKPS